MPDISSSDSEPELWDISGGGWGCAILVSIMIASSLFAGNLPSAGAGGTGRSVGNGGASSLLLHGNGLPGRSDRISYILSEDYTLSWVSP